MSSQKISDPIDVVITWVDGDDPVHLRKLEAELGWRAMRRPKAAAKTRFADRGELEYCVVSILRFAPWVRHIFIVTDEQVPGFLAALPMTATDRISVVDHKDIYREAIEGLPTFNSLSIETMLWRIPGLANNFIYFNDDCFLVKPVAAEDFFEEDNVVLRGICRPLINLSVRKRIKRLLGLARPTRRTLQSEAARMAGGLDHYLDVDHIPHPMRVCTLRDYFSKHPQRMHRNASYPLRHSRQFWPVSLANHLELKHGTAILSSLPESLYLSSRMSVDDIESLVELEARPMCKFLCAQSLDNASEEFLRFWAGWMDKVVGRADSVNRGSN